MATTIQISEVTRQLLRTLQEKSKRSYDEILSQVLKEYIDTPDSLAGKFPNLKWNKNDRMKYRDE